LGVTNRFMEAVEKDQAWDLLNPRTGRVSSTVKARSIFEVATAMAWENGDPGMIFLDRINRDNPTPNLGPIEAVNLCGEQPLLPYEACNLGSINLVKMIRGYTEVARRPVEIDWKRLAEVVKIAVRFLDDVISIGRYPLPKVDRMVKGNRKIGLGMMGWADTLIKLGIPYDSQEALNLAERVMKFINKTAHLASQKLGKEKGSFPNFVGSRWQKRVRWMRNATCTTIAPTGSISMVAGVSSGIEPLFALSYFKEVLGGARLPEVNQELLMQLKNLKTKKLEKIEAEIIKTGKAGHLKEISAKLRRIFVTTHEIAPTFHAKMQAAFQKYTDNAVSKTINLAKEATVEDVEAALIQAWKLGCKGITIYRDKSRKSQVLNVGSPAFAKATAGKDTCPNCGQKLVRGEGCLTCPACGFSVCEL